VQACRWSTASTPRLSRYATIASISASRFGSLALPQRRHAVAGLHRLRVAQPGRQVLRRVVDDGRADGGAQAEVGEAGEVGAPDGEARGVAVDRVAGDAALLGDELPAPLDERVGLRQSGVAAFWKAATQAS
jgi:hypothetical protein